MSGFIIAGTSSGAGKTVITTALMGILKRRGLKVAPFKCGPDYIDPQFHRFVTGVDSINLDSYLLDKATLKTTYLRHCAGSDIALAEGVMGLYDGLGNSELGSTALTAKTTGLPVILVVDGRGLSRSIAALIKGFIDFDRDVRIAGIILNRLSSEHHYRLLEEIIMTECNLPTFGYLPKESLFGLESRHLGLIPAGEITELSEQLEKIVERAGETLKVDELIALSRREAPILPAASQNITQVPGGSRLRVAIASDKAFNFYYKDNLLMMEEEGLELVPFSPLQSEQLPPRIDALYFGGGYPEQFAAELSANHMLLKQIKSRLEEGLPAYAECGGLMYLTEGIYNLEGQFYPMVGHFKAEARMTKRLQRFGYVEVACRGEKIRAHEFHHSLVEPREGADHTLLYKVHKASRPMEWQCGLSRQNVLAAYAHLHFLANPAFFRKIIMRLLRGEK